MDITMVLAVAVASYLFGSISLSRLVGRLVAPDVDLGDVRIAEADGTEREPLRTIGATTASIELGPRVGCSIALLDILKGALPIVVVRWLEPDQYLFLVAGVFVVVGHNWPVFHHFRGGGGMSPTYGGFLAISPLGALGSAVLGLLFGVFVVRDILVAYTSGLWFFLLWLIATREWPYVVYGLVMNVLFIVALIPDTRDYLQKKRSGQRDLGDSMDQIPMTRGLRRMMAFFHVEPRS